MSSLLEENQDLQIYSSAELALVKRARFPSRIAIIMDGNRRWAKKHHLPAFLGHRYGAETLLRIVRAASALGVEVLTAFAFSTENWNRSADEIDSIMGLLKLYLIEQKQEMIRSGVRFNVIGDLAALPIELVELIEETKRDTADGQKIELVVALNYGGRDEIRRAVQTIVNKALAGEVSYQNISEQTISKSLDTANWPDPELLIRTSGEQRLSNFLLWQISYSEVYISQLLWPDFDERELLKAILEYQQRDKRYGA